MLRPVSSLNTALFAVLALASGALALTPGSALAAARSNAAPAPGLVRADSAYGLFLVGREAMQSGDNQDAAAYFEALATAYPDQPAVRRHAFTAALLAGDIPGAARFAPREVSADDRSELESLGRIVRADEALATGRAAEAVKLLEPAKIGLQYRTAAYLLKPWALAAAGDWKAALATPDAGGDRLTELFIQLGRAQLFELKGRTAEAEAAYKAVATGDLSATLFKTPYGEFLERHGRSREAIALYDAALAADPDEDALIDARARAVAKRRPPPVSNLDRGAAQALTYAADAAKAARQPQWALIYLRLALRLDPTFDEALIQAGEALAQAGDTPSARAAWQAVSPGSRLWTGARSRLAYSLSQNGDLEGGVKLARETLQARPHDLQSELVLADLLRDADKDQESLAVLDQMVKDGAEKDWRVRYMRAIEDDKLGRWSAAEPELKAALELAPDEPDVQNYLGYSWIEHGDHIKEGLALVEKAVAARPNSGAIQDSLGWAHYRLGDFGQAVTLLEKAVELEPADPAINDHLGDAYYRVGRKLEAGYQWTRVLSLDPDKTLKAAVERKLHDGLPATVAGL
jgi:tetratricopeptide (TPR) repeat protein